MLHQRHLTHSNVNARHLFAAVECLGSAVTKKAIHMATKHMAGTDKGLKHIDSHTHTRHKKKEVFVCRHQRRWSIFRVFMWRSSGRACVSHKTMGAMVGADAIMRRASSFSISWSSATRRWHRPITSSLRRVGLPIGRRPNPSHASPVPTYRPSPSPHHRSSFPPPCAGPAPFSNLFSPPPPPFPPSFLLRQTLPPIPKVARSWSRGRLQLSSLGCLSSRVSSARRSIPLPFFYLFLFFSGNCFHLLSFNQNFVTDS